MANKLKDFKSGPAPGPYKEPAPIFHELWSAISPGDLGLKVGYWTWKDSDPMIFRPIVGWVTAMIRTPPFTDGNPPKNGFYPVVLSKMFPVLGGLLPNYCAAFLKEMTEDEAKDQAREWRESNASGSDTSELLQPTMGMGQA